MNLKKDSIEELFIKNLLNWYEVNRRDFPWRKTKDPYEILIAEILLQKTIASNVKKLFPIFIERFPSVLELSFALEEEIENIIKPLGIYKRKAESFKKIADKIIKDYNSKIPSHKKELLSLFMVGEYVSNATLCFAFNTRVSLIDVNIFRIINRVFSIKDKKDIRKKLDTLIPADFFKEFNWALIDLGALFCSKIAPKCKSCPLKKICQLYILH